METLIPVMVTSNETQVKSSSVFCSNHQRIIRNTCSISHWCYYL